MAEQLSSIERSLVGGITVCGVYVVSGEPNAKKVLDTLQRAVEAYAKKRDLPLNLLHVSTQSSQYTCRVRAPEAKVSGLWLMMVVMRTKGGRGVSSIGSGVMALTHVSLPLSGAHLHLQGELAAVELKYQALVGKLSLYHSLVSLDVALPPSGGGQGRGSS